MQRRFVLNIFERSCSQREAYVLAGGTSKTPESQDACASKMLSNAKVKAFYDTLTASCTSRAILTREEALEILTSNAKMADEHRDQHAAIKQLSDMQGWNAPKKAELTGSGGKNLALDVQVSSKEIASALNGLLKKI